MCLVASLGLCFFKVAYFFGVDFMVRVFFRCDVMGLHFFFRVDIRDLTFLRLAILEPSFLFLVENSKYGT